MEKAKFRDPGILRSYLRSTLKDPGFQHAPLVRHRIDYFHGAAVAVRVQGARWMLGRRTLRVRRWILGAQNGLIDVPAVRARLTLVWTDSHQLNIQIPRFTSLRVSTDTSCPITFPKNTKTTHPQIDALSTVTIGKGATDQPARSHALTSPTLENPSKASSLSSLITRTAAKILGTRGSVRQTSSRCRCESTFGMLYISTDLQRFSWRRWTIQQERSVQNSVTRYRERQRSSRFLWVLVRWLAVQNVAMATQSQKGATMNFLCSSKVGR